MSFTRTILKCFSIWLPTALKKQLVNFRTLAFKYGQYKTIRIWECVDSNSNKLPWYTYPAIEYLNNIDFSDKTIFEYGSGNSSSYWAKKAKSVFSVEHNKEWYEKVKGSISKNQEIRLCETKKDYLNAIFEVSGKIDVIVIDGMHRKECAQLARNHLSDDGIIILDNSDWHQETSSYLRDDLDLLEVDFHGFGPINAYTWTTSLFFSRSARPQPLNNIQPQFSIAAVESNNDEKVN